jgi:phage tail tube protein FII
MQMSREHARVRNKHIANIIDTGVAATSGVPNDWCTIQAMHQELKQRELILESDEEAQEVSVVVRHRIRQILTGKWKQGPASIDKSREYISFGCLTSDDSDPSGE